MTPKYLVIGSCAMQYFFDIGRKPKDTDIICTYDDMKLLLKQMEVKSTYPIDSGKKQVAFCTNGDIYEFEIAWPNSCAEEILNSCGYIRWYKAIGDCALYAAPIEILYMLKMSHRFKKDSPHFLKTMQDIRLIREKSPWVELNLQNELKTLYERRMAETYTNSLPKLNQSKESFFNDSVPYTLDHDSIHEAIKISHQPAYKFFKPKDSEVMVSKEMWDNCSYDIKLLAGYEEACVLAIERSLHPFPNGKTTLEAFEYALMKICTSVTSGWFRLWCWEHYDNILTFHNTAGYNYYNRFKKCLESGYVKLYKEQ